MLMVKPTSLPEFVFYLHFDVNLIMRYFKFEGKIILCSSLVFERPAYM